MGAARVRSDQGAQSRWKAKRSTLNQSINRLISPLDQMASPCSEITPRKIPTTFRAAPLEAAYRSVWAFLHDEKLSFKRRGWRRHPLVRQRAQWARAGPIFGAHFK